MGRKKIREYDAKQLLKRALGGAAAARCVQVTEDTSLFHLRKQHAWLDAEPLVVKPDMLFGQRGKHNLLLVNANLAAAQSFVEERLGREITLASGARGPVTHFLIEPFVRHTCEYYLCFSSRRDGVTVTFNPQGGIEIESNWASSVEVVVPTDTSVAAPYAPFDETLVASAPEAHRGVLSAFIRSVYNVFQNYDATLIEFNPLTIVAASESDATLVVVPLDMRCELDDTAAYLNEKKWAGIEFPQPFGRPPIPEEAFVRSLDEKTGASLKLTVLNPNGHIWLLVAGGGASVIVADTVCDLGGSEELANYGEYSGGPSEEETYDYARTVLSLATRSEPDGKCRSLIIGGGVANFTDVAKTMQGIVFALREYRDKLRALSFKIFVRRAGPNDVAGLEQMRKLSYEINVPIVVYGREVDMTTIVPLAIAHVKSKPLAA